MLSVVYSGMRRKNHNRKIGTLILIRKGGSEDSDPLFQSISGSGSTSKWDGSATLIVSNVWKNYEENYCIKWAVWYFLNLASVLVSMTSFDKWVKLFHLLPTSKTQNLELPWILALHKKCALTDIMSNNWPQTDLHWPLLTS